MKASDVREEIRKIEKSIEELKHKYGSFEKLYRFVEYQEPLGFQVDYLEAFNDLCDWREHQNELLKKNMKEVKRF